MFNNLIPFNIFSMFLLLNISSNNITYKGGQIIFEDLSEQQSIIDLNISSIEGTNRNHLNYLGVINIEKFYFINILKKRKLWN